jgi:AcrR family transcriptional regulator
MAEAALKPTEIARPRWERRKESRPSELLAAALELFVERGYTATKLDEVASRAGVSKGTLYLYFENKEELLKAVVRESIGRNIAEAQALVENFHGPSTELLRQVIDGWWATIGDSPASGISKLMMSECGNFPEIAAFYVDEVITPAHQVMQATIERGIARGEFRALPDPQLFVRIVIAPLVMLTLWKNSFGPCCNQPLDPQKYLATHLDATLAALRPA